jgi:hypothetical protein
VEAVFTEAHEMETANEQVRLVPLIVKTAIVHTLTYFIFGALAATVLDYQAAFARPELACWMRQFGDPLILAGPLFQPIRGLVFALAIYPFREIIFGRKRGFLTLWWLLVSLGIINTFGPAPGSIEGVIYTVIPPRDQFAGYLEVVPQALLLSLMLVYWTNHPEKRWLNWVFSTAFVAVITLSLTALLIRVPQSEHGSRTGFFHTQVHEIAKRSAIT